MKHLIVGYGEVGKAMHKIFPEAQTYDSNNHKDGSMTASDGYDVMHICFPYSDNFVKDVEDYQEICKPRITIIHSSVPIGTSNKLNAVHSPVRGVHPNLEKGLRTFVKFFGGPKAYECCNIFEEKGIECNCIRDSRTTEALKLWDTTQYGIMILLEKEIYKFCRDNGVDFEIVYGAANSSYNVGYTELDMPYVVRPALMHYEGKIGGHCVVENAHLLDTPSAKRIIEENGKM